MIDFENYERVTKKDEWGTALKDVNMDDLYSNLSKIEQITVEYALDRLAELEDLIEKNKLVPKYFIIKNLDFWHLGYFHKNCYDFHQYRTKEEAETKLKELMESDK